MHRVFVFVTLALALVVTAGVAPRAAIAAGADSSRSLPTSVPPETLRFTPGPEDSSGRPVPAAHWPGGPPEQWLQAPFGDGLLTDLEAWRTRRHAGYQGDMIVDYNRVDQLRAGANVQVGPVHGMLPRVGSRLEYSTGRDRFLYGLQVEQPLVESGRYLVGGSFVDRTDHGDLQHIGDIENTLAMLFGRQDYRDYFGREGGSIYLQARWRRFSNVSLLWRADRWRSLPLQEGTRSWFHTDRDLRDNPPIDDGTSRAVSLRFERLAHRTAQTRSGTYHWIDLERAGAGLGGDFTYTRALFDVRNVLRLSPASTLSLRGVLGTTLAGTLTRQREFTVGGVDGLRAHSFAQYRGNQAALGQAEYTIGFWRFSTHLFEGGLHAIGFVDTGRAWQGPHHWDVTKQQFQTDGGLGLSTSEDNVRVYVARDLQKSHAKAVWSLRLQRPF